MSQSSATSDPGQCPTGSVAGSPTDRSASGRLGVPLATGVARYGAGARQLVAGAALHGDGVPVVVQRLGNSGPQCIGVSRRRTRYYCKEEEEEMSTFKSPASEISA